MVGFGCLCVIVYPAIRSSTEQGLPARRPCTRARSVPRQNYCPRCGFPPSASRLFGSPQTRSRRGCDFRGHPCPLTRPYALVGNNFNAPTFSANHQVCKERIGGGFLSARSALRLHSAMIFTPPPDCKSLGMSGKNSSWDFAERGCVHVLRLHSAMIFMPPPTCNSLGMSGKSRAFIPLQFPGFSQK